MYRHNPLPVQISKQKLNKPTRKRNILFSSPKLQQITEKVRSIEKAKQPRSESRERSIHRIDSKEKPKMLTEHRANKSFEQSTAEYQHSYNLSPVKNKQTNPLTSYFNVGSLLKSKQTADSSLKESFQRPFACQEQTKIMRISNRHKKDQVKIAISNQYADNQILKIDVSQMIVQNSWQMYEGETQNGLFEGYGILHLANGDKFVGFFRHNLPQGHGSYYPKGVAEVICGLWQMGRLVINF